MPVPTEKELLDAACHIGHPKQKWNPRMAPYIYGVRRGIHVFDLTQTRDGLSRVCTEISALKKAGKVVLFVSTKQQGLAALDELFAATGQPTVTKKWIPGLLTNWSSLRKRLKYYLDLKRAFQTGEVEKYTKKERVELRKKLAKLEIALGGVSAMENLPDALFVVDAVLDQVAVKEAKKLGIPVYGICDTNANPALFTICIPANDDSVKSITVILKTVQEALTKKEREEEAVPT